MARGFPTVPTMVALTLVGLAVSALAVSPPFTMKRSVMASGGAVTGSASYQSNGTAGQSGVGPTQGTQYQARMGYRTRSSQTATALDPGIPGLPVRYELEQNHPNPFNPVTTIGFALPKAGRVVVVLHDVRGRRVRTLVDADLPAGRHDVVLNADDLASGVYWYTLQSLSFTQTRKLVLVK